MMRRMMNTTIAHKPQVSRRDASDWQGYGAAFDNLMQDYDQDAGFKLPTIAANPDLRDQFERTFPTAKADTRDRMAQMLDLKKPMTVDDYKMSLLYAVGLGLHIGGGLALHTMPSALQHVDAALKSAAPLKADASDDQVPVSQQIDQFHDQIEQACAGLHAKASDPAQRQELQTTHDGLADLIPETYIELTDPENVPHKIGDFQDSVAAAYLVGLSIGALDGVLCLHPQQQPPPPPTP